MKIKDGSGIAIGLISGLAVAGVLAERVLGSRSREDQSPSVRGSRLIILPRGLTVVGDWQTPTYGQVRERDAANMGSAWYRYVLSRAEQLRYSGMSQSDSYRKASNEFYSK
jgi:hypothetical protein